MRSCPTSPRAPKDDGPVIATASSSSAVATNVATVASAASPRGGVLGAAFATLTPSLSSSSSSSTSEPYWTVLLGGDPTHLAHLFEPDHNHDDSNSSFLTTATTSTSAAATTSSANSSPSLSRVPLISTSSNPDFQYLAPQVEVSSSHFPRLVPSANNWKKPLL